MKHLDQELLWDLAAGNADVDAQAKALDHVNTCVQCKNDFALIETIHKETYRIEHDSPSMRFTVSVMERVEEFLKSDKSIKFWERIMKYLIVASMVFIGVTCIIILARHKFNPLEYIPDIDGMLFLLIATCAGLWIFYLMDKMFERIYAD